MKNIEKLINECIKMEESVVNDFFKVDVFKCKKELEDYKQAQALQLQQTGVSGCFSYKEALEFLQLHTPIAVKPIKKSKYKFVQPFTSKNARDIVIFSLATELSKNNR